ncbi:MAG: hypothetical protein K6F44_07355 [Lachnospiraceae bacterium]|nr:hypothetical protein [Lachnospiraceae bacterium]
MKDYIIPKKVYLVIIFGGYSSWTIARYYFKETGLANQYGGIVLEFLRDEGYFYSVEDSIDELRD